MELDSCLPLPKWILFVHAQCAYGVCVSLHEHVCICNFNPARGGEKEKDREGGRERRMRRRGGILLG